jgi:hypothetical protein
LDQLVSVIGTTWLGALDTIIARVMTEAGTAGAKYSGASRPAQLKKRTTNKGGSDG